MAKLVIRFLNALAEAVNGDPAMAGKLSVFFFPNYGVSCAEKIFPAGDLSEQISTAGYEASGTGNMKAALNGGVTIGTLDGANIEILEAVGPENIFIFGKTTDEIAALRKAGDDPKRHVAASAELERAIAEIPGLAGAEDGAFLPDRGRAARAGPLLQLRRFCVFRRRAGSRREGLRNGSVDADVDPQCRRHGPVLVRPGRARVRRADLAGDARAREVRGLRPSPAARDMAEAHGAPYLRHQGKPRTGAGVGSISPHIPCRTLEGAAPAGEGEPMSDQDVIQKAYEADLTQIYGVFVSTFTTAQGDKPTEAETEVQFQRSVAHARHIRDRALALLGEKSAAKRRTAPAGA